MASLSFPGVAISGGAALVVATSCITCSVRLFQGRHVGSEEMVTTLLCGFLSAGMLLAMVQLLLRMGYTSSDEDPAGQGSGRQGVKFAGCPEDPLEDSRSACSYNRYLAIFGVGLLIVFALLFVSVGGRFGRLF